MFGLEDRFPAPARFATAMDELHALAAGLAGSGDFGEDDYRLGLRVLLESMDYDPHFTPRGRDVAWGCLVTTLVSRGRAVQAMKALPGLEQVPLGSPVVVTGLHRSGTTALHRLLAVDPRFQGLQSWLIGAPMPRPPRETWTEQPALHEMAERLAARMSSVPAMKTMHESLADEVDECIGILMQSFTNVIWTSPWSAASYDSWWQSQSERPAYLYYRRVLQLIGSSEPDKRWLLKEPSHLANLDLLLEVLPGAKVIWTHRDPAKAVPSLCSMLIAQHPLMEVDRREQRARLMGHREVAKAVHNVAHAERVGFAHTGQMLNVRHVDFHRDPMAVIRRIYPFIGMELTPEVEALMLASVAAKSAAPQDAHRYDPADFDLTDDAIREPFGDYLDRFDLRPADTRQPEAA